MKTTTLTVIEPDVGHPKVMFYTGVDDMDGREQVRRLTLLVHSALATSIQLGDRVGIDPAVMVRHIVRNVPALDHYAEDES